MTESEDESLSLMPLIDARLRLEAKPLRVVILRPPYPAAGEGELRVLRVRHRDGRTEIVAGYDAYARLADLQLGKRL